MKDEGLHSRLHSISKPPPDPLSDCLPPAWGSGCQDVSFQPHASSHDDHRLTNPNSRTPFFSLSAGLGLLALFSSALVRLPVTADPMGFGDLKTPAGLQVLNDYLADKSYIEGEKASLPGVKKSLGKYGPASVADTTGSGAADAKDDDDIDLFGSDVEEESEDAKRLREERLARYESKKAKMPAVVAKSSISLDVKPWDDETDMTKLEECVRSIQVDGL
ncbi:rCG63641, partial [Rattus norvegicus]